ncbi:MAG: hypothetical protein ACJ8R9_06370 [Steroidobacteraceae bacterium]
MPRSIYRGVAAALRGARVCPALICALVLAPAARAESIPASVRACALETDSLKRLICFDREVARYSDQPSTGGATQPPAGLPPTRDLRSQPTTPKVPPGPPREDRSDSAEQPVAPAAPAAPKPPRHIGARIVSIENFPDALVLHLDNDQVWQQIQEASADVNLHAGDTVSIDRELGSYWLSGGNGVAIKVKQKK